MSFLLLLLGGGKLGESAHQPRLVGRHAARHEDVAGEAQAQADEGDVFNRVFEDYVDGAVVSGREGRVGGCPEVGPVVVEL